MRVLVVNAGSSSLKLRLLAADDRLEASLDLAMPVDRCEMESALAGLPPADVVGHRIVHGGERFREPVLVDAAVEAALRELVDLAPLHQPKSIAALEAVSASLPGLPAVACFDTAFHATLGAAAATYALPARWRQRFGLRRFGFHGLSHAYAARRAAQMVGREGPRVVSCHLGAGASLAAIAAGRCQDTTMGFTPLEGMVMATRAGSVDPGLLLWLIEKEGLGAGEVAEALEHESGLLALAGSADMRDVLAGAEEGRAGAELALGVYVHRLRALIGAMAAALGGIEALVFTGGVGERAAPVRAAAVERLGFLGIALDPELNALAAGDADVSATGAAASVLVIESREDLEIARQARALLAEGS